MKTLRPALRRPVAVTAKTGVASPPLRSSSASKKLDTLVTTASLQRGRVYFYRNIEFERGVVTMLDTTLIAKFNPGVQPPCSPQELADELSDLYESVTDGDGDAYEKPIFVVKHDQERPPTKEEQAKIERPRRLRQFVEIDQPPATRISRVARVGR